MCTEFFRANLIMSQVQSTTVVNAGRCINAQDKIFGAKHMETDPSVESFLVLSSEEVSQVQSTIVVNAGCCVVTHLKFVEIQNLEGRRQTGTCSVVPSVTAYHQALVFHRNESQTKCCLAVTSTTHAWRSKAIFSVEGHRRCRAPQLSTQGVVCVHGSFSSVRIEGDCPEVLFARGTSQVQSTTVVNAERCMCTREFSSVRI